VDNHTESQEIAKKSRMSRRVGILEFWEFPLHHPPFKDTYDPTVVKIMVLVKTSMEVHAGKVKSHKCNEGGTQGGLQIRTVKSVMVH